MEKHIIQILIEASGRRTRSYRWSGEGSGCLAVSIEDGIGDLMGDIFEQAFDQIEKHFDRGAVEEAIRSVRVDALGRGEIAYFPGIKFGTERA
jgi:hypothetical protein